MSKKDDDAVKQYLSKIGSKGGKTRAAKHTKQQLSQWAKKGGRPKKDSGSAQKKASKG
jgi:hypothetical protein